MLIRSLRSLARVALHSLGIVRAVRASKRRKCRVIFYHRFPRDRSQLAAQCEHIRRYYNPVSMRQVAEASGTDAELPHNALAVTVDDGFRDFLDNAQPVFSRYEIPVTVFVVTDFLDGKSWPWFSQIAYVVSRINGHSIRFLDREFIVREDRVRAAIKITEALKSLPNADRIAQLEAFRGQLGIEVPGRPPPEYEALAWDDVRRLAEEGVEFGSHTRTHPILSRISDPAELHQEIAGSKYRLEEQLGFPCLHFSYPFGTLTDLSDQTVAVVRKSGFVTAVTAQSGFNDARSDPFRLFRLGVDPTLPERRFIELLAGVRKY
jgi:peptidoglycan/xylan/chitin deacetylase (PgdA/CDA1 family)